MNRNIFSLVFNRARNMLVVAPEIATGAHKASRGKRVRLQSGCGRGASGTAFVFAAAPWLLTASLAVACMPVAHAQTVTNPGFETGNLTGWTPGPDTGTQSSSSYSSTGVGVSVVTGMTSFDSTSGQSPGTYSWTVDPYGTYMASLQATGTLSGSNGFSNAMTAMGLDSTSSTAISTALGGTVTNAAWITQSLNLTAGQSFTMAWEYISTDYQPYNDGSITSLVNTSSPTTLATVNNQNAQYALLGATNTGTGDYSTGSYGSTGWETATYTVSQAGTYLLGFASFNLTDEVNSPILFVDQQPGLTYNNGVLFNPIAANAGTGAPSPTPTNIVIDTAQPYYGTSTLGSATSATFDGGTLKVDQTNPTVTQDFGIDSTNGIIDQAGQASVFTGTISDATSGTPGALTITNSGSGGSVTLSGNNTYSGGTTITGGSTVLVSSSGNLGTGGVTLDNGTLETTAGFTDTRNYVLNSGGGTLDTDGNNVTLQGGISGSGGLTVANSGSGGALTLTGTDTYTGSTAVDAGATLALTGSGSIASSSGLTDNGNFDISGASSTETLASLGGSGTVALGNNSLALSNAGDTFTGVISGNGGVLMNGGTEAFAGANTYTGGTTLNGGTLQVSSDGNLGAASGALNFNGGTLENTASFTSGRDINLVGDANFNTDAGTTLTDTSGAITGSGNINKQGTGTLVLGSIDSTGGVNVNAGSLQVAGQSTYTGATSVASGATLALTGNGSIAGSSGVADNGTFDISGANGNSAITTLSGGGTVDLGGHTLDLTAASGNFSGVIQGNGGIEVAGGTQTLSGANTYIGATTVDNGATLALSGNASLSTYALSAGVIDNGTFDISGASGDQSITTLSGSGNVVLGANHLALTNASGTYAGVMSGSGGLVVDYGPETLTGANTYTGGTDLAGGKLIVSANNNLGASTGALSFGNAELENTASFTTTRNINIANQAHFTTDAGTVLTDTAGTISGTGSIIKEGTGTLILGVDGASGGQDVTAGTLVLTGASTDTGATSIESGATLALSGNGSIAAAGGLTDNGTFDISAANGDTSVRSLSGGGVVNLGSNSLAFTGAYGSFGGVIGGSGGIAMDAGTQTLSGSNTYTGGTTLNGGTLQVSSDANLGDAGGTLNFNGGTLENTATFTTTRNIDLTGPAVFNTDTGTVLTDTAGTISGSGPIVKEGLGTLILGADQSTGGLNVNGGTLALTGASTDTGATNIASGATLAITGNGSDASASSINDSGTLDLSGANGGQSIASLSGNGAVSLGGNGLTLTNANGNFGGSIGGTGGVTLAGGTEALSGSNTYTGGTTLNGGTLQVSSDANLGDAAGALNFNGGTLENTATFTTTRNIDLTGPAVFNTDTGTVLTDTAGTISGSGPIVKEGLGTLILGADQSTGGLNVNGGTLQLTGTSTDTGATNIASGATLAITGNGSDASASSINNSGTLDLSGANGGQSIASLAGNGAVNLGANGLTLTNANGNFGGSIGGTGGVTLAGGTEVLSGSNTYTGGTTLTGGNLVVNSDANLGASGTPVTFNGGTLTVTQSINTSRDFAIQSGGAGFNAPTGVTVQDSGNISGNGGLVKSGGGTLVVSGANTFTGGTLIDGGVVQIDTGSSLGTGTIMLNGGTLQTTASLNNNQNVVVSGNAGVNVNAGTSTLMAGTIQQASGSGCFVKSGTGELDLTGSAVLSGGTCVEQGMLRANGHLVSDVSVYAPGELRGIGLINGPINVNGRLAPGNSPGTLTVTGTVTMNAGSTYEEDIDGLGTGTGKGNYSRLIITGANSQFIANGTLMPQLRGITGNASNTYVPSIGDVYQIVVAQGGIVGQFNSLTQPEGLAAGTRFVAFYNVSNNHSIELGVLPDSYASLIAGSGANRNAVAAAQALDSALNLQASGTATAGQSELLLALASAKSSQLGGVMDNLAGQVYADQAAAARASGQVIQSDTLGHLVTDDSNTGSVQPGHLAWATASHEGNRWSGDAQGSGFQTGSNQISVGVDLLADHGSVIGIGAVNHHTDVLGGVAQGAIYGTDAIVYGQQPIASVLLDGMAAIGHDTWTTRRNDPTGTSGGMFSWVGGNDRMASIVARMPIQAGGTRIEPYASVTWQHIERNAVDEAGTSSAALKVGKLSASGARAKLGVNLDSNQQDPLATEITYQVGAAVGEDSRGLLSPAVQETLQGATFSTKAPLVGRSFVELHANGTMRLTRSTYLYGGLTDEAGVRRSAYGVSAGVRVKF